MFTPRSSALTLASSLLASLLASSASAADLDLPPPPPPLVVQQAPAPAPQPAIRGDFQATGGAYAVDNGYSDRAFMGLQGSLYDDTGSAFTWMRFMCSEKKRRPSWRPDFHTPLRQVPG